MDTQISLRPTADSARRADDTEHVLANPQGRQVGQPGVVSDDETGAAEKVDAVGG
ncbi:hypothetical protein Airi02_090320 [Actinoallomurus iriomotensis]|uniref:Uncharacterized protein n=1 Tax=Actinoallomurus iriomotensis TaxID=478107 RepID=A0A9W6VZE6_9ACTN|nr:hypothetical protein Airi02_090320 [Actinoallomurus iriomotensis]